MKVEGIGSANLPLQQQRGRTGAAPDRQDAGPGAAGAGPGGDKAVSEARAGQAGRAAGAALNREVLEEAVEKANQTMETYRTELRFKVHEGSGEMMVKVINAEDDTVIREIPPENILDFVAHVKKMLGIIIDKFI
jgi:flagellar protein FlaG